MSYLYLFVVSGMLFSVVPVWMHRRHKRELSELKELNRLTWEKFLQKTYHYGTLVEAGQSEGLMYLSIKGLTMAYDHLKIEYEKTQSEEIRRILFLLEDVITGEFSLSYTRIKEFQASFRQLLKEHNHLQ